MPVGQIDTLHAAIKHSTLRKHSDVAGMASALVITLDAQTARSRVRAKGGGTTRRSGSCLAPQTPQDLAYRTSPGWARPTPQGSAREWDRMTAPRTARRSGSTPPRASTPWPRAPSRPRRGTRARLPTRARCSTARTAPRGRRRRGR